MQPSWVTDEEFGMGYLDIKPPAATKSMSGVAAGQSSSSTVVSQNELASGRAVASASQHGDSGNSSREQSSRVKSERTDTHVRSDPAHQKVKVGSLTNGSDSFSVAGPVGTSRAAENQKQVDESTNRILDDGTARTSQKNSGESEVFYGLFLVICINREPSGQNVGTIDCQLNCMKSYRYFNVDDRVRKLLFALAYTMISV